MGVPDFLKFVSRSSPASLCRIPKNGNAGSLCFDFVLIDATNAYQTLGLEKLLQFLKNPQFRVHRAIIFAMDAQRHRAGTTRGGRTHATVLDFDVSIQHMCCELQQYYRLHNGDASPQVLVSGRQVAGEADYKILDMQRELVTLALASRTEIPSFCLISEDSDVLCGALCGPAPHRVSIATSLHDTVFEICVLRLTHFLAHIAACVEAFSDEADGFGEHQPSGTGGNHNDKLNAVASVAEKTEKEEDEVVRRKKKDGPLVETGTVQAILTDSDSESDREEDVLTETLEPLSSSQAIILTRDIAAAEILQSSCVDMVFLFVLVMGNGTNLPPVIRGATKVDIQSCWRVYCRMKYDTAKPGREKEMGRSLLCLHDVVERTEQQSAVVGSISVDCSFLLAILEATHYADAQSRPSPEQEKEQALFFLSQIAYTTMRYVIGCNMYSDCAPEETFLDTRLLSKDQVCVPSLAAFLWVLGQSKKRTLHFPLRGLATDKVLSNAACGLSAVETAINAERSLVRNLSQNVVLHGDVGRTLVTADSGMTQTLQLRNLLRKSAPDACKDIVTCINKCVDECAVAGNISRPSRSAPFSQLVFLWQRTIASYLPALKIIAQSEKLVSPFACAANGGETRCASRDGFPAPNSEKVRQAYSFELRRMAPVLSSSSATSVGQLPAACLQNASLLNALRVSYDYNETPSMEISTDAASGAAASVATLGKRQQSSRQKHQMEQQQIVKGGESLKKRAKCEAVVEGKDKTKPTGVGSTKYRRPGKKEREKLKKKNKSR